MAEDIQRKLQFELDQLKSIQKDYQKTVATRQQLDGQLNENQMVKDEFDLLKPECLVYKSVGPVLIKTELTEAKQNVSKRMDFINKEIKRVDDQIATMERKQDNHKEQLQKLQHQFQQAQVKAAMNA